QVDGQCNPPQPPCGLLGRDGDSVEPFDDFSLRHELLLGEERGFDTNIFAASGKSLDRECVYRRRDAGTGRFARIGAEKLGWIDLTLHAGYQIALKKECPRATTLTSNGVH